MRRSERHVPGIEVGPRGWPGSGFIVRVCVRGGFSVKDLQETLDEWGLQDGVGDWGTGGQGDWLVRLLLGGIPSRFSGRLGWGG